MQSEHSRHGVETAPAADEEEKPSGSSDRASLTRQGAVRRLADALFLGLLGFPWFGPARLDRRAPGVWPISRVGVMGVICSWFRPLPSPARSQAPIRASP